MNWFQHLINKFELKSAVVILCIGGALGVAYIDKQQRNAFMTIAITATGGFFGAEIPAAAKAKLKRDDAEIAELKSEDEK